VIGFLSATMPLGRAIGIFAASAYALLFVAAVLFRDARPGADRGCLSCRKLCEGAALLSLRNQDGSIAAALAEDPPQGFLDAVPGAQTLLLLYDPDVLDPARLDFSRDRGGPRHASWRLQAATTARIWTTLPVSWT